MDLISKVVNSTNINSTQEQSRASELYSADVKPQCDSVSLRLNDSQEDLCIL